MKNGILAAAVIVLAAAAFAWSRSAQERAASLAAQAQARVSALEAEVRALAAAQAQEAEARVRLEVRLDEVAEASRSGNVVDVAGAAVQGEAESAQTAGAEAGGDVDGEERDPADPAREEKIREALESLFAGGASGNERQAIWRRLAKDGLLDDAVKALEARVKENPGDPDRHAALGEACLQKTIASGGGDIEKGEWAMKADRAFDKALELNPEHWGARFAKAVSLSFWPPILGKQPEATKHFEMLVEQQERQASRPEFAETYLFLGGLYQSQGNGAMAREVWKKGADLFPDSAELAKRLESAGAE